MTRAERKAKIYNGKGWKDEDTKDLKNGGVGSLMI